MNRPHSLRRYRLSGASQVLGGDPVIPREVLRSISDASGLIGSARQRCAQRLREARQRQKSHASRALARQVHTMEEKFRALTEQTIGEARAFMQSLRAEQQRIQTNADQVTWQLACAALEHLMLEHPAEAAIRSCVRLAFATQAGGEFDGAVVLRVNPADALTVVAPHVSVEWTLETDVALPRGVCVLTHGSGLVRADFRVNVASIVSALARSDVSSDRQEICTQLDDPLLQKDSQ